MDKLRTINSPVNSKRCALTQKPIAEFFLLGALLTGLQHGLNGSAVDNIDDNRVALSPVSRTLANAPTTRHQRLINFSVERINNPRWPAHQSEYVAAPSAIAQHSKAKFESLANKAKPEYQFDLVVGHKTLAAQNSSAWSINADQQERLAVWQTSKRFAFSSTKTNPTKPEATNDDFVVMLDPGHGGTDRGSVGHNGLAEKLLTLDIAKRAQRILSKLDGVSIVLTRNDDTGMSRKNRVEKVKSANADMVVSLHLNHLPQKDINLVETFYAAPHNILESIEKQRLAEGSNPLVKALGNHGPDLSFTEGSKQLASMMQRRVYNEVSHEYEETDNAGIKEDTLYILTRSFTPGVLIELSCLSNVREAERLADPAYRQRLAEALADGVRDYLSTPAAKQQFGAGV